VTGEERRFADPEGKPANHVACTVEMTNLTTVCKENENINLIFYSIPQMMSL
jgi:hypothetical protein